MYRPAYSRRFRGLGAASVVDLINQYASQLGVPSSLAVAVAQKESSLNQNAVGSAGEIGVFQLMPATAAGLNVDPTDLTENVQGGVSYLSQLYTQFGNWFQTLEAYNAGPTAVLSGNVPSAAQAYATSVLAASGLSSESSASTPLGTSDTGLLASLDSGISDISGDGTLSVGSDPTLWLVLGLLGVGVVWWASR